MTDYVTVYEPGDQVWTISSTGEAIVWTVQSDGTLTRRWGPR